MVLLANCSKSISVLFAVCLGLGPTDMGWCQGFQNVAANSPGASPQTQDGFAPATPVQTFIDSNTGQLYGRYILYETVPVAKYEFKPVIERQFVPEWVQETKQTTQVQYIPFVTYQLQPVNVTNWNPFAPPRQSWQYVPVVQYQPKYTAVNQPITYQKYVEKEVTKYVPEMVVKGEKVAKYEDRPISASGQIGVPTAANQQPSPIRPIDQVALNNGTFVYAAPNAYYANQLSSSGNLAQAWFPAPSNSPAGWHYGTRWGTSTYAANPALVPQTQFVNNPTPNVGLVKFDQTPPLLAYNHYQLPGLFSRTGSLFSGGFFLNRPANVSPSPPPTFGGAPMVASNPIPSVVQSGWNSGMIKSPWLGNPTTAGSGFSLRTPSYSGPQSGWSLRPVDGYRDPAQVGWR